MKTGEYCAFPKGHVEPGESEAETAARETWEETSLTPMLDTDFRYEMTYKLHNGNEKTVVYFLADFGNQVPKRNGAFEKFDYLILPFTEAYQSISFENARQMLASANDYLLEKL